MFYRKTIKKLEYRITELEEQLTELTSDFEKVEKALAEFDFQKERTEKKNVFSYTKGTELRYIDQPQLVKLSKLIKYIEEKEQIHYDAKEERFVF